MSLEAALGVIVFAAAIGIWGGAAVSTFIERESGAETAERFNTPILMGIVILVLLALAVGFLLSNFNIPAFDRFSVVFVLLNVLVAGVIGGGLIHIVWKRRRLTADEIVLDAGRNIHLVKLLIGAFFGFAIVRALVEYLLIGGNNLDEFVAFLPIGVLTVGWTMSGFAKVYLTKEGISLFRLSPVQWEQIHDYVWGFRNKNKVILILKGGRRVEFSVSNEYKEQVEEVLQAKIKGREMQPVVQGVVQG